MMAAIMAMRWSLAASTMPPARLSTPWMTRPSSVVLQLPPRAFTQAQTVSRRSDSLMRSRAAPVTVVVPAEQAATAARGGTRSGQLRTSRRVPRGLSGVTSTAPGWRETRAPSRARAPRTARSPWTLSGLTPVTRTGFPSAAAQSQNAALLQSPPTVTPPGETSPGLGPTVSERAPPSGVATFLRATSTPNSLRAAMVRSM